MRRWVLTAAALVLFAGVLAWPLGHLAGSQIARCDQPQRAPLAVRVTDPGSWRARAVDNASCRTWRILQRRSSKRKQP